MYSRLTLVSRSVKSNHCSTKMVGSVGRWGSVGVRNCSLAFLMPSAHASVTLAAAVSARWALSVYWSFRVTVYLSVDLHRIIGCCSKSHACCVLCQADSTPPSLSCAERSSATGRRGGERSGSTARWLQRGPRGGRRVVSADGWQGCGCDFDPDQIAVVDVHYFAVD